VIRREGWIQRDGYITTGWFDYMKGGRRMVEGWSKDGRRMVEGWSKGGRMVVDGWLNGG
jgi:hypothetical protein